MEQGRFAVMGNPIEHSLSPRIHQCFGAQFGLAIRYEKILADLNHFEQQVKDFFQQGGVGLNITLPCKERAFVLSDVATKRCQKAKAANTLWMKDNKLIADNTDGVGFLRDIERYVNIRAKRILLLGAGGAARGILGPLLDKKPARVTLSNRTEEKARALQKEYSGIHVSPWERLGETGPYHVVINATSLSLKINHVNELNIPLSIFSSKPFCYDMAYSVHGTTFFVQYALQLGCSAIDGLGFLLEQAREAFYLWHGLYPETMPVLKDLRRYG